MADELFKLNGKEVTASTKTELEARAKQLANPELKSNKWVTQRQVWFQLTSMGQLVDKVTASKEQVEKVDKLSKEDKAILVKQLGISGVEFNKRLSEARKVAGVTAAQVVIKSVPNDMESIGGIYESTTLRPSTPAINSIKITKLGELGSTKKATVELTFFSAQQFADYEPYLFVPGISIRLEWGWSVGAAFGPQTPMATTYLDDAKGNNQILKKAEKNPNYDGFQGKVVNFEYAIVGDRWVGTVEIIAAGASLSDKPIDDTSQHCSCVQESEDPNDKEKEDKPLSNVEAALLALHDDPEGAMDSLRSLYSGRAKVYYINFRARDRNPKGEQSDGSNWEFDTKETFISLESLADLINLRTGYVNGFDNTDGAVVFTINGKKVTIPSFKGIISTNSYVCILPGQIKRFEADHPELKEIAKENADWIHRMGTAVVDDLNAKVDFAADLATDIVVNVEEAVVEGFDEARDRVSSGVENVAGFFGIDASPLTRAVGEGIDAGIEKRDQLIQGGINQINAVVGAGESLGEWVNNLHPAIKIGATVLSGPLAPLVGGAFVANHMQQVARTAGSVLETYVKGGEAEVFNNGDDTLGYIGNILINTRHAYKVFQDNKSVGSFFLTLLKDVSHFCGDFWEFDMVDVTTEERNPKSPALITFIDNKDAHSTKEVPVYNIRATPTSDKMSVVKTLDLKTKLTEGMKTQALYATGPARGETAECPNRFTYIRSGAGKVSAVQNRGEIQRALPTGGCIETKSCDEEHDPEGAFIKAIGKVVYKLTDERGEKAAVAFRTYLQSLNAKIDPATSQTFMNCPTISYPWELRIGLDGIGGFRWGQYIKCDRLPPRYQTTLTGTSFAWQVIAVEHEITPNDWKTSVNTQLRFTSNKAK